MWHCYWPQLPAAAPNAHFHNLLFLIRGDSDHCSRIWSLNFTNVIYKFCRDRTSIIHYMESVSRQGKARALGQYSGTLSWSMQSPRNDSRLDCFVCTQRALNVVLDALGRLGLMLLAGRETCLWLCYNLFINRYYVHRHTLLV